MRSRPLAACLFLLGFLAFTARAQERRTPPKAPDNRYDARLEPIRQANAIWTRDARSKRRVVDFVCLVPDVPTFLEAITWWDADTYFPILIEDVPNTLRFLRAFRPAKVVRFPRKADPIPRERLWKTAVRAVERAAGPETSRTDSPNQGGSNSVEKGSLGVVLSAPESPSLAAAVALAAGRSQRFARLDSPQKYDEVLSLEQMNEFALGVEAAVRSVSNDYRGLGDECDFITLAGDWPYRYQTPKDGARCLDDLIGRSTTTVERWAFAGRLLNDPTFAVYQAMCSLFLQTESVALFNGYPETGEPWSEYRMNEAASRLSALFPVDLVSGERAATLSGWHRTFDPRNRHGLVMINSKGGPTQFDLFERGGQTLDVPPSVPTAVLMIHSFSAADPQNPATIAGRWLANGAFVYHGSMNEPYLQSFRTPRLTANLIVEGLPLGVAMRSMKSEMFGQPWKLIYIGDPLYRVSPRSRMEARVDAPESTKDWPRYISKPRPTPDADASVVLGWGIQTTIERTTREGAQKPLNEVGDALVAVDRGELEPALRPVLDELLVETLYTSGRFQELRLHVSRIPPAERSALVKHLAQSSIVVALNSSKERSFEDALALWDETLRLNLGGDLLNYATSFVGHLANTPSRRLVFRADLRGGLRRTKQSESEKLLQQAIEQVERAIQADTASPSRERK